MLLAWRASHAVMLLISVHGGASSDPRHSLPTDPVLDPTPVELMAGGANRVCLRPGRPEADSWLAGPQCFEDVGERLGLEDDVNFVAVLSQSCKYLSMSTPTIQYSMHAYACPH